MLKKPILVASLIILFQSLSGAALIGHWPFDELSGTTAVDTANANNAVNTGGGLTWQTGVIGGAARLDGASVAGHDFQVASIPQMSGATALTISCWVNAEGTGTYKGIIMTRDVTDTNGTGRNWGLARVNGSNFDGRVSNAGTSSSANSAPASTWHHIVLVWDGASQTRQVYVNGVADPASPLATSTPSSITSSGLWYFGLDPSNIGRHFAGAIDDVAMWDSALSAAEIATIHQGGLDGLTAPAALAGDPPPVSRDYYVATNGDNSNDGSLASPFRDVAKATQLARPGDTIYIRAGVYREKVVAGRSGKSGEPITFSAYNGEAVVVSTADLVNSWTLESGDVNGDGSNDSDVWSASVAWDAGTDGVGNTLFVDGTLKLEARQGAENDPLEFSNWGQIPSGRLTLTGFRPNDLNGWGDDFWNGAKVRHHTTDWAYTDSVIADYQSSNGQITFATALGSISQKHTIGYTIFDTIKALNEAGEWFKDRSANTLYYKASGGQNPNSLTMEFKARDYCFDVRGSDYIHIVGIECRGGTIQTDGETNYNVWSGNKIYAYDKGNFGRSFISGSHNIFRDNEVSQSWGSVASISGTHQQVVNNYFHDIGYTPVARVITMGGSDHLISHNTVRKFARSFLDGFPVRSEFSYNLFEDGANLSWDTGVFDGDAGRGNGGGCIVHHNVIKGHNPIGIYMGFYSGVDLTFHHNIIYDFSSTTTMRTGFRTFLNYYHNTFIGPEPLTAFGDIPLNSSYQNNIQLTIDKVGDLGMTFRGNHDYSTSDFVNFAGGDFRLQASSGAIDRGVVLPGINDGYQGSAPDAGALEYGEAMFAVGHDFVTPHNPVFNWFVVSGTNLEQNAQFNNFPEEWTLIGNASWFYANTWNGSGLGRQGNRNIRLMPTDGFLRTFTGLKSDTWYTVGSEILLIDVKVEAEAFDGSLPASVNSGSHRGETYVDGLNAGDWLSYNAFDFGVSGQYDQMELQYSFPPSGGALGSDTGQLEVRLGSATGQLLGTFEFNPLAQDNWFVTRVSVPATTGPQTLYLVPIGTGTDRLRLGNLRLLSSNVSAEDQVEVRVANHGGTDVISHMGEASWKLRYDTFSFKTGPASTTVDVTFSNTGAYDAYVDSFILFEGAPSGTDAADTGVAIQSSDSNGSIARQAINEAGNTDAAVTQSGSGNWWQVDLGQSQGVTGINLTPDLAASGILSDFKVSLWNTDPRGGGSPLWERTYVAAASPQSGETLAIKCLDYGDDGTTPLESIKARYMRVELLGTGSLGIANAEVLTREADNLVLSDSEVFQTTSAWQAVFPQVVNLGEVKILNSDDSNYQELSNFTVSVWDRAPADGGVIVWQKSYFPTGSVDRGGLFVVSGDELGSDGTTRLASVLGRFVQIENAGINAAGNNNLSLEEVVLKDAAAVLPASNIALQGQATQSSDLYSTGGKAPLAINGVILPIRDFTTTQSESNPWWEVELKEVSSIDQIVLFNRIDAADRIGNFRVSVLNDSRSEIFGRNYSYSNGDLPAGGSLTIDDDVSGARYVRVQINGTNFLSLPEVQVWSSVSTTLRLDSAATNFNFDLGALSSPVMGGWTRVSPETTGDVWWEGDVDAIDRGVISGVNLINRDLIRGDGPATLNLRLPDGAWDVVFNMGDMIDPHDEMMVWAEGILRTSGNGLDSDPANSPPGPVPYLSFQVLVTDGVLNLQFDDNGGVDPYWAATRLSLTRAGNVPTTETMTVDLARTDFRYDFGAIDSVVATGWSRLSADIAGDISWSTPVSATDRGATSGDLNRDFISGSATTTLEHAVSNGIWNVSLKMGDATNSHDQMQVSGEGSLTLSPNPVDSSSAVFTAVNGLVIVTDGSLSLEFSDLGGSDPDWVINSLELWKISDQTTLLDSDSDGLPDVYEQALYGHPTDNTDGQGDYDGDGLTDLFEYVHYGHPTSGTDGSGDVDSDGFSDALEFAVGSDANDALSIPQLSSSALAGHWPMDETTGGTAADASGLGHDAVWAGTSGENVWVSGLIGGASQANDENGGSGQEHFRIANLSSLDGANGFTLSLWFNQNVDTNNNTTYNGLFTTRDLRSSLGSGSGENWGFALENNSSPRHIDWRVNGGAHPETNNIVGDIVDEWHHILYVWDGSAGMVHLYQDGVLQTSSSTSSGSILTGGEWRIGDDACCGGREFTGTFDDVAVFGEALNATDATMVYQTGLSGISIGSLVPAASVTSPVVSTGVASNVTQTTADVAYTLSDDGGEASALTLYYGTSDGGSVAGNWASSQALGTQTTGSASAALSGLTDGTIYYYTIYASNSAGSAWGSTSSFTTDVLITAPVVTTSVASNVAETTADVAYTVSADGGEAPTLTLYYGQSDGGTVPGNWTSSQAVGTQAVGSGSSSLSGLTDGVTYYYTVYASNSGGSDWGTTGSFTTNVLITAPVVSTGATSNITQTTADVAYTVSDDGGEAPALTLYYGETDGGTTPANWTNSQALGTQAVGSGSAGLSGLTDGTTYYYSVYASNTAGNDWGSVSSFTTEASASVKLVRTTVSAVSSSSWTSVNLGQTYNSAVIIATPIYSSSSVPPMVTRIRNVVGSSFEVKIDRADGLTGAVTTDVSIIAVEEGVYTQATDGVTMEAVKYTSTVTGRKNSWVTEARSYQNSYTNPVVVGQVMSAADANWSVFWSQGSSRTSPPSATALNVGKHVAEDTNTTRADETVGYIVIESGSGNINGVTYSAGLGSDIVRGPDNSSSGYTYTLSGLSSASAAAVSLAGMDGGDGGWAVLLGPTPFTSTSITMLADEDAINDSERKHTTEQVSYLVFE